ncbi:hypothetical protein FSP39_022331 [Pinctada imbricata]|uniref:DNA-directed DNA polymerase n=1 Tax=Pinctada imbricata TaxID=66713 RepID=A0AA89BWD6_PINIB|nr:hypothetical protein FSP39_022331 [Pinctada imbricata]
MTFRGTNEYTARNYPGIPLEEIHQLEQCFQVNINIFEMREDGSVFPIRKSIKHHQDTMNLNMFDEHLSYISNMKTYSKKYQCTTCDRCFPSSWRCLQHERRCENKTKFVYPGGFHNQHPTIFETLDEYGIHTDLDLRYYPYFIVYDFEAILLPQDPVDHTKKLKWQAEHQPISVSVCSNVTGHEQPRCFVCTDPKELVTRMVEYMSEIAETANQLACERWEEVNIDLNEQIDIWEEEEESYASRTMVKALRKLETSFDKYSRQIPVLGFNSSNYDLNLVKTHIATQLRLHDTKGVTIKRDNSYTCISNETLKFLDISNYLAAGTSYASFLKAYGIPESKGFFPYEYLSHPDKLQDTCLPPHEAFYSSIKGKNITKEEYQYCQQMWNTHQMSTMEDFLVWYNNLDVEPFVKAVEKMQDFYFEKGIDIFKVAMTIPGIARQMLFQASKESGASFSLFGEKDKDLFKTIKNNIVGGPSIIFNRHSKVGTTYIRNNKEKPCKRIIGFDANALYLWALNQAIPTGTYVRRRQDTGFKPEIRDMYASSYHWMDWLTKTTHYDIKHKLNYGREKRIGPFPVDGFCANTSTVFQFQGCYFHGHDCYITENITDEKWRNQREKKLEKTRETSEFIRDKGHTLVEIWECEYQTLKANTPTLMNLIDEKSPKFYQRYKKSVSENQILNAVKEGTLFGMLEVDIQVPEQWPAHFASSRSPYDYFEEMAPLFCTTDIPFEVIGPHMQDYAERHGLSKKPRRLLVGGMKAKKILLATPLLQWYIQHGLQITQVYQVIEYTPMRCFRTFVETVTNARRQGDANPDMKVIADTNKTIGNSAFGGVIMDKTKHTNISYVKGMQAVQDAVNQSEFVRCTQLNNDVYEIEKSKNTIRLDLPIQIGYFVLQYGKLRMLEFYYDFMDAYCDRKDFAYCEMDTDSAYMAISGETIKSIIKPEMTAKYLHGLQGFCHVNDIESDNGYHWFPRECCPLHQKRDTRTPGLFKVEYEGDEIIGLCSKTYIVSKTKYLSPCTYMSARRLVNKARGYISKIKLNKINSKPKPSKECKFSSKGISKRNVKSPLKTFQKVIKTAISVSGFNRGFRAKNNAIFTYQQERTGFSYFYCKRQVLDNGIDTRVLDITLCPDK